ncbi:MAG: hypothetical protein NVSMB63_08550 [Sediminibacterium sp.]
MQSTGNDIIALYTINKERSNDSRFYAKILSPSEQALYHRPEFAGLSFEHFLWLSWSIKESVYKYLKRGLPDLVFSPTRIIIRHIDLPQDQQLTGFEGRQWEGTAFGESCYKGSFIFGSTTFYFRSKIYRELIATVVSEDENFEDTWWGIRTIDHSAADHQSKAVRSFLLSKLDAVLPGKDLQIKKSTLGYPIVLRGTKELKLPVSFAHHGRFIAYSFLLSFS